MPGDKKSFEEIASQEKEHWENNYKLYGYSNIFNVTKEKSVCKKLSDCITEGIKDILIPGCGSEAHLQKYISQKHNLRSIYCTDWSKEAIKLAKIQYQSDRIKYQIEDSSNFSFDDFSFDMVIICNSILSGSDDFNKRMLSECSRVLKDGGFLCGLFPTIFSALDMSMSQIVLKVWQHDGTINLVESKLYEIKQSLGQILYTPLGLRKRLKSGGFKVNEMSIVFFDSEFMLKEGEKIYNVPKSFDLPVWELLVKAKKY